MNSELYLALQTVPFIDIDGVFAVNIESLKEKLPEQDSELFVNYVEPIYLKQLENIRISDTDMQKYRDGLGTPESVDEYLALQRELKYQAINYGDIHNLNGYAAAMSEIKTTAEARNPSVGYARNITTIMHKDNPFSDVTLENQKYLYPDESGTFKTLSFKNGSLLKKISYNNDEYLAAITQFVIEKTTDRTTSNTIELDESISEELPTEENGHQILYI